VLDYILSVYLIIISKHSGMHCLKKVTNLNDRVGVETLAHGS